MISARPSSQGRSLFEQGFAFLEQLIELRLLIGNAVGVSLFIRRSRIGRGLFHKLTEIVLNQLYAFLDFCKRCFVGHQCLEFFPNRERIPQYSARGSKYEMLTEIVSY